MNNKKPYLHETLVRIKFKHIKIDAHCNICLNKVKHLEGQSYKCIMCDYTTFNPLHDGNFKQLPVLKIRCNKDFLDGLRSTTYPLGWYYDNLTDNTQLKIVYENYENKINTNLKHCHNCWTHNNNVSKFCINCKSYIKYNLSIFISKEKLKSIVKNNFISRTLKQECLKLLKLYNIDIGAKKPYTGNRSAKKVIR